MRQASESMDQDHERRQSNNAALTMKSQWVCFLLGPCTRGSLLFDRHALVLLVPPTPYRNPSPRLKPRMLPRAQLARARSVFFLRGKAQAAHPQDCNPWPCMCHSFARALLRLGANRQPVASPQGLCTTHQDEESERGVGEGCSAGMGTSACVSSTIGTVGAWFVSPAIRGCRQLGDRRTCLGTARGDCAQRIGSIKATRAQIRCRTGSGASSSR